MIDKARSSAFAGSALHVAPCLQGIVEPAICNVSTGGIVLATFMAASDEDYRLTVRSDVCAGLLPLLHAKLMASVFARSCRVMTVDEWAGNLSGVQP